MSNLNNFLKKIVNQLIENTPRDFQEKNKHNIRLFKIKLKTVYDSFFSGLGKISRQIHRPKFPNHPNGAINLHLGCGAINHPEFINIDALNLPHIHFVRKIDNLKPFKNESVKLIYASHCLEHFPIDKVPIVLKEWHRVLKEDGILRLSVPDFDLILNIYRDTGRNMEDVIRILMGGQDYEYNFHLCSFNENYLSQLLKDVGFKMVRKWTPGTDKMTSFDDWSGRPVLIAGRAYPVSLNLEAVK
ncbi:class I SAM-dependent methyltransferase [Synechococcus sp. BDU 130192]|uniref:class I SAM-dependent methyltransferase n=1 Tax=Synechococcus sp. BDU 130192 TaxID=2042059 RepID=UPI000C077120|nr:methyltransferase domain-containing protein [Synechococcus sp. BDU 130192]